MTGFVSDDLHGVPKGFMMPAAMVSLSVLVLTIWLLARSERLRRHGVGGGA